MALRIKRIARANTSFSFSEIDDPSQPTLVDQQVGYNRNDGSLYIGDGGIVKKIISENSGSEVYNVLSENVVRPDGTTVEETLAKTVTSEDFDGIVSPIADSAANRILFSGYAQNPLLIEPLKANDIVYIEAGFLAFGGSSNGACKGVLQVNSEGNKIEGSLFSMIPVSVMEWGLVSINLSEGQITSSLSPMHVHIYVSSSPLSPVLQFNQEMIFRKIVRIGGNTI